VRGLAAGVVLALAGCATPYNNWQKAGLTPEILLDLEKEDWGGPLGQTEWPKVAAEMGVPVDARPIAVRDVKCRSEGTGFFGCHYVVDWGRNSSIEGSFRRDYETLAKDQQGHWANHWIVID
jgi:hypothetical protein